MVFYFTVDENNRLEGVSSTPQNTPNEIRMEFSDDHEIVKNPMMSFFYKYVDGKLIKDDEYRKEWISEREAEKNKPSDEEMNAIALMELTELTMGR